MASVRGNTRLENKEQETIERTEKVGLPRLLNCFLFRSPCFQISD